MSVFMTVQQYFDYWSFVVSFGIRKGEIANLFFQQCFGYLVYLEILYEF